MALVATIQVHESIASQTKQPDNAIRGPGRNLPEPDAAQRATITSSLCEPRLVPRLGTESGLGEACIQLFQFDEKSVTKSLKLIIKPNVWILNLS